MTRRSIDDIAARADEVANAFENYDPKPGDRDAALPPAMAAKLAAWRRDSAEKELVEAARQRYSASAWPQPRQLRRRRSESKKGTPIILAMVGVPYQELWWVLPGSNR